MGNIRRLIRKDVLTFGVAQCEQAQELLQEVDGRMKQTQRAPDRRIRRRQRPS